MGVKDTVTKDYMNDPRIFADAFNYLPIVPQIF